jgi:hypothetical protein
MALQIVNEHARRLFSFLLEVGTPLLVPGSWRGFDCLCLKHNEWSLVLYIEDYNGMREKEQRDEQSDIDLTALKVPTSSVTFKDFPDSQSLRVFVEQRKSQVIGLIHNLVLEDQDIEDILLHARSSCLPTLIATKNM